MTGKVKGIVVNGFLIIVAVLTVYPVVVMLMDSLKTAGELSLNPEGLPLHPTLANFEGLLHYNGGLIVLTLFNAVGIALSSTLITLVLSSMAAFGFAKYQFRGKEWMFLALMATMMIPYQLELPSMFLLMSRIGWLNTYWVQIFPGVANVFAMFLIRQYMLSIPDSVLESARIDGASDWTVFQRIVVPMVAPILGAAFILVFLARWNAYIWPLVTVNSPSKLPITVLLPTLSSSASVYIIPWPLVLAGCVVVTVPLIIVFLIFQDRFMRSVTMGAVKE